MLAWLLPITSAGLLGSLHCVGMCGGIVAVASEGADGAKQRITVQAGYQLARLGSYMALGAVAGGIGHALDLAGQAAGLGKAAAALAGVTMIGWGLLAMLRAVGLRLRLPELGLPTFLTSWLARGAARPPLGRAVLLGAASALLPCGFLYAFALAAAGTASPLGGALVMAALWLGNLPALLGFGLVLATALSRLRRHLPILSATSVLVLGLFTLSNRTNLPAFAVSAAFAAKPQGASLPMPADCPCHRKHRP
jgi:sulfite exporter TauE/SafE